MLSNLHANADKLLTMFDVYEVQFQLFCWFLIFLNCQTTQIRYFSDTSRHQGDIRRASAAAGEKRLRPDDPEIGHKGFAIHADTWLWPLSFEFKVESSLVDFFGILEYQNYQAMTSGILSGEKGPFMKISK